MHDKFKTCQDCPDRVAMPNCHMTCEGYLARCKKNEAIKKAKSEYREEIDFYVKSTERVRKYKKR